MTFPGRTTGACAACCILRHFPSRHVYRGFCLLAATALLTCWMPGFAAALRHGAAALAPASLVAVQLSTDARVEPIGVDSLHPRMGWQLAAVTGEGRGLRQTAYRVLVASSAEALAQGRGDIWDSGRVASGAQREIRCGCEGLKPQTKYLWKVMTWDQAGAASAWSATASWYTGMLGTSAWQAHWIATEPDAAEQPTATREGVDRPESKPKPLPLFRREFTAGSPVASAVVSVSGLGQYELRVNGKDVTESVLNPGWTDYRKRVLYNTYDVTALVKPGANALGVMLGNGMYDVQNLAGRYTKFTGTYGQPKVILQLTIRYKDGAVSTVVTDKKWTSAPGPIVLSSIYGGEDYDARREQAGWDHAGFAGTVWQAAKEVSGPGGELVAQQAQPLVVAHTFNAVSSKTFTDKSVVYDLGENFSGWPNLVVQGVSGSRVKLLPGELLDETGHVTQRSNNAHPGAENSFTYTLKGGGVERWHPQFSYNGFRYVEVFPEGGAHVLTVSGSFLHDDVAVTGEFASSNKLFVQIHQLIDQAIQSNMVSVLTDCPTREKLGWLEQTHLAATSIMYNYDVELMYEKMAADMGTAQLADGLVPSIAPEYVAFVDKQGNSTAFRDSPEWGSALVLSTLTAYRFYGDTANLAEHYEQMQKYVAYLKTKSQGSMLSYGLGDWYDIGPAEPGVSQLTSKSVTATAIYYQDLQGMAEIARVLEKRDDVARYTSEAAAVKEAFNRELFRPETAQYDRGSQTANAMPLALGLVPEDRREAVLANLVADIRKHGNHITAGDIGYHYVVRALTDGGRSDVLAEMLSRTDSPSYGYQLTQGATSLTEAWDANRTSSQNHFMLGHAEEWFYRGLAGIDIDMTRNEQERIEIHPVAVPQVDEAEAKVMTVLGEVRSRWQKSEAGIEYEITVPAGQQASVSLPTAAGARLTEKGEQVAPGHGVLSMRCTDHSVEMTLGSGTYAFSVR